MAARRVVSTLSAVALVAVSMGCGSGGDEAATTTVVADPPPETLDTTADTGAEGTDTTTDTVTDTEVTEAPTDTVTDSEVTETTAATDGALPPPVTDPDGEPGQASCPEVPDEVREIIDGAAPEAPAPGSLADVVLPDDQDAVIAVLGALPDELIGGTKEIVARTPADLAAMYQPADRASQTGFQVADLRSSFIGSMLPEPRADIFVVFWVLSDDDDFVIEAAGHDGDLYWVTFVTTSSGVGIEGTEQGYTMAFGRACSPWGFLAAAPTETERDELIAAFVAAAELVAAAPEPEPPTPDEQAAQAALLTLDELGAEWLSSPNLPTDEQAFNDLVTSMMADEPSCEAAHAWVEREGVVLGGLLDILAATSIAHVESPTFVSGPDGREVEQTIIVFETEGRRSDAFAASRELGWVDCIFAVYDDVTQAQYASQGPGFSVSVVSAVERPVSAGDDATSLRFELEFEAPDGSSLSVIQDISIVAVGRAVSSIYHQRVGDEVGDDQVDEVTSLATGLLAKQFGESE